MKKKHNFGFYTVMIAPATVLFILIIAYPIIRSIILSFTAIEFSVETGVTRAVFAGFDNYIKIFSDPLFYRALINNLIVVCVSIFGQIPIALGLAYCLYRRYVRFSGFFQAMMFLPQTISTIIIGLLWNWLVLNPQGVLSKIIQIITGNPHASMTLGSDLSTAMLPIAFALIWIYTGFFVLIFSANLQKIGSEALEAAEIDGASEWQIFRYIIVPSQVGAIVVNAILAISGSLKGFDLIWAMTKGGPADYTIVLPIYMYKYGFQSRDLSAFTFGSAIATVIIIISIVFIVVARKMGDHFENK